MLMLEWAVPVTVPAGQEVAGRQRRHGCRCLEYESQDLW